MQRSPPDWDAEDGDGRGGARGAYDPDFKDLVIRHLDRMSRAETNPGVGSEAAERVLHAGVLFLYDVTEPILGEIPHLAREWNSVTKGAAKEGAGVRYARRREPPTDSGDDGDNDGDGEEGEGGEGAGSAEVPNQPNRSFGISQETRRAQRRVLVKALMESGVLRRQTLEPWSIDKVPDGAAWELADADPPEGIRASERPDDVPDPEDYDPPEDARDPAPGSRR